MKVRFGKTLVLAASLALCSLAAVSPASAAPATLTHTQETQLRTLLTKFLVPAAQQTSLIAKYEKGQTWDVYLGTGPTTTEERTIGDMDYTITRYADGSVKAGGIEKPQTEFLKANSVVPQSINGCKYTTGSGYHNATNCTIDGLWGSIYLAEHNVSYSNIQGGPDQITATGYGAMSCSVVTCTTPARIIYVPKESGSTKAHVRWQSDVTSCVLVCKSWNVWFQLNVGSDTASETNS